MMLKKFLPLLLCAALLLCACAKEEPAPEPEPAAAVEPPREPVEEVEPAAEPSPQPEPELEPAAEPEPAEDVEPVPEPDAPGQGAVVTALVNEGSVEESVGYRLTFPTVSGAAGAGTINEYYGNAAARLRDLAWGELYEQSLDEHTILNLEADYEVTRNDGVYLSVYRTVSAGGRTAAYAETFELATGALLTADDVFDAPEADYQARLVEAVTRLIEEDPEHSQTYSAQWEERAAEAFDHDQFYLTDDAYVVFYQSGELGGAAETRFPIPFRRIADLLKIEV